MQAVAPAWLDPLREQLLPALQAAGLDLDTRSRLNIEAWIDAAQNRALLSDDPICAKGALRVIVSKSGRDQQLFDQVFDSWRQHWDHCVDVLGNAAAATPPPKQPVLASQGRLHLRILLALVAVLVVTGPFIHSAYKLYKTPTFEAAPPPAAPPAPPHPEERQAPSVPESQFATAAFDGGEVQAPPWLFGVHPAAYAVLIMAFASVGWFTGRTRKAQLARITTRENLREQQVFARQLLPISGERRAALRAAARRLRRPRPTGRRSLDIDASTRATASRAGVFAPVHRQSMAMPEYLLLVDRAGSGDQQAHWAAAMARDLVAEGVTLALYEFDRDPRWVAPLHTHRSTGLGAAQTYLPLAILGARHAGQGLIVLGDGHGFIDPASAALHDWLQTALAPWPRRVLMTPRPPASWGAAEDIIAGEGQPANSDAFLVLPAQIEMLSAAVRWFDAGEVPDVDLLPGAPALLPALLDDDMGRWVGREAPAARELVALVEQLRGFLGPTAYTWLAASAAYPYLSADLTAYFASQLNDASPSAASGAAAPADARLLEARLVGIAQLPWCRSGLMPDWLRRALFLSLAPATRERVRAVLAKLFRAAGQDDAALGMSLGMVASEPPEPTIKGPLSMLRDLGRRIGLAGVVENEAVDSPLRDVIYLGILRGDFDASLTLEAEEEFARVVRSEIGTRLTRNPLRWLEALVIAAVYPLVWLKWWASRPLPGQVMGTGRAFLQLWRETYSDVERFYAAIGNWFARLGPRLFGTRPAATSARQPGPQVYLSFSRSEAGGAARGLHERLVATLGLASVWDDRELNSGTSWAEDILRALDRCTVIVAFLGRTPFRGETWQIEEIAHALRAGKRIVPVLLDGATMPDSADLPPLIRDLTHFQAFELRARNFDADLNRLTNEIAHWVNQDRGPK